MFLEVEQIDLFSTDFNTIQLKDCADENSSILIILIPTKLCFHTNEIGYIADLAFSNKLYIRKTSKCE